MLGHRLGRSTPCIRSKVQSVRDAWKHLHGLHKIITHWYVAWMHATTNKHAELGMPARSTALPQSHMAAVECMANGSTQQLVDPLRFTSTATVHPGGHLDDEHEHGCQPLQHIVPAHAAFNQQKPCQWLQAEGHMCGVVLVQLKPCSITTLMQACTSSQHHHHTSPVAGAADQGTALVR